MGPSPDQLVTPLTQQRGSGNMEFLELILVKSCLYRESPPGVS
jgi:hypothetical protein